MVPRLVRTSTCGSAASAPEGTAATERRKRCLRFMRLLAFRGELCRPFIENFPASAFLDPVLALAQDIGQAVRPVVLVEGHDDEIALARVAQHRDALQAHLDPA